MSYRHVVVVMMLWLLGGAQSHSQVSINGKPAFCDSVSNLVLFTIPQEAFGHDFTATVCIDPASPWREINANGQLNGGNPITFKQVSGDKVYALKAMVGGKPVVKRIMFTYLPIMRLEGDFGYAYADARVTLLTPDGTLDQAMKAQVKWRGGFTNGANRHKRNYSIKFVDANGDKQNRKLLDMRRDNHWKLDAAQVDMSRVRNRVATDLWLDMAREPYYIDQAPDAIMAARGKPVEVFVGNSYMGIYHLLECVDRKQLQVKKWDEDTGLIHGMMWNAIKYTKVTAFKSGGPYDNTSGDYNSFAVEYPELEEVCPTNYEDLYRAVIFAAYCTIKRFNYSAHEYFDMPVVIDYAILNQVLISVDNEANNIYWAIYDREQDKKLTLAVWDLDWSLGTNRDSPDFRGGRAAPDYEFEFSNRLLNMMQNPSCIYHDAMVQRYWELRSTWLSEASLTERVTRAVNRLIDCGAAARDEARWSGDSDINGLTLNLAAERDYINDWIKKRLAFLDRTLMRRPCDVDADGGITAADVSAITTLLLDGGDYDPKIDVDGDGHITSTDLFHVYQQLLENEKNSN